MVEKVHSLLVSAHPFKTEGNKPIYIRELSKNYQYSSCIKEFIKTRSKIVHKGSKLHILLLDRR